MASPTRLLVVLSGVALAGLVGGLGGRALAHHGTYDNMYPNAIGYLASYDCHDSGIYGQAFCQTDNNTLTWYAYESGVASVGANTAARIPEVLEDTFEATDLNVSRQTSPVWSGTAETDIIYYKDSAVPEEYYAVTFCGDATNSVECDRHEVVLEEPGFGAKVICHESGHAVGLSHGSDATPSIGSGNDTLHCLQTPLTQIDSPQLGPHNSFEIDGTY